MEKQCPIQKVLSNAFAFYILALATKSIVTKHPTPPSTVVLSKESQSKIRHLAGWTVFLDSITASRSAICENSQYPSSLTNIERYNHGGLVHVTDNFFVFVLTLEKICSENFTQEIADFYKWDTVKSSREKIRTDPRLA